MSDKTTTQAPPPRYVDIKDALPAEEASVGVEDQVESPVRFSDLDRETFMDLASRDKVQMLEILAAELLAVGYAAARAQAKFYRIKILSPDSKTDLAEATANRNQLDVEYDAIKHTVSALQSALKVERLGIYPSRDE